MARPPKEKNTLKDRNGILSVGSLSWLDALACGAPGPELVGAQETWLPWVTVIGTKALRRIRTRFRLTF